MQIGAVLGGQRHADAGVGSDLMAKAFVGCSDRIKNAGDEVDDFRLCLDRGLHHREFIAAEPGHEVVSLDAAAQARRHRFQQFVANQMAERIVDILEFVNVDIEHRQLFARHYPRQFMLQPLDGTIRGWAGRSADRSAPDA